MELKNLHQNFKREMNKFKGNLKKANQRKNLLARTFN